MTRLTTTVDIDAPPEAVWEVLTEFDAYSTWNPFITSASGTAAPDERLRIRVEPPDSRGGTFRPRVLEATPNHRLVWLGHLGVPRLFDGRHEFELEARADGRTRLIHSESFSGILVRLLLDETNVRRGFEAMNVALKDRAESRAAV
jgi:hypothetical protein